MERVFQRPLNRRALWLTLACQVAWCSGRTPKDWQSGVIICIHKKGDRREYNDYRGISLLCFPGNVNAKCLVKICREIMEPKLDDTQCGLSPGYSTTNEIFTLQPIFEKSWEYARDVCACFVDLEKANDRVPREKLWECCGRTVLTAACHWRSSHCIPTQAFPTGRWS